MKDQGDENVRLALVPRFSDQGYDPDAVRQRRQWLADRSSVSRRDLDLLDAGDLDTEAWRGNVENAIGVAQVPIGIAGPLLVHGEHARGVFYVPLATTEGALVRSYERGMLALSKAGGVTARVWDDRNRATPVFDYPDLEAVSRAVEALPTLEPELAAAAEATTQHGRWRGVYPRPIGRRLMLEMRFATGDAHGMNMIAKAVDAAARRFAEATNAERTVVMSGHGAEKRAAGSLFGGGKGKRVTAAARLPARQVSMRLHASPAELARLWRRTVVGHLESGAVGYNGHYANGLTALFIACGQDVANVTNAAVGITELEATADGDLYASVNLHALTVATVGGGTGIATAPACLELLGCRGSGHARKLAEIAAATLLAGELSMAAALASGEFVAAHEAYGRNRPDPPGRDDGA